MRRAPPPRFPLDLHPSIVHVAHGVRRVADQVQNDLLKLDPIAGDEQRVVRVKLKAQVHSVAQQVAKHQLQHLARRLVQVHGLGRGGLLAEQRTQARDDVGGAVAVADGAARGFLRALDVQRIGRQHPQAGVVMMPASGWLTSCAIDAVKVPRLITRVTCASSDRALSIAASASRRCVTS